MGDWIAPLFDGALFDYEEEEEAPSELRELLAYCPTGKL